MTVGTASVESEFRDISQLKRQIKIYVFHFIKRIFFTRFARDISFAALLIEGKQMSSGTHSIMENGNFVA